MTMTCLNSPATIAVPLSLMMSIAAIGGPAVVFTDITDQAGIGLPDTLTESIAWGDYDDDGDQDLYLSNLGANNLFRNDGNGDFTDVTAVAQVDGMGADMDDVFSVGVAFGDLDGDGDLDLYGVTIALGFDFVYRNDGPIGPDGQHVFTYMSETAGLDNLASTRGMALLDYDHDGLLDVYVTAIGPDALYHNLGNFQFEDVALDLGVGTLGTGVGAVATDVDNNGWIDIFTGNRSFEPNRLYLNFEGVFTDITKEAGIGEVGLGMGVISFDYDNDLDMDLYWTSWPDAPNAFYENIDGDSFINVAVGTMTDDPLGWGISGNAGDIDNDGWEDFFVTNGFADNTTPNVLFYNNGNGTFADITNVLGGADTDGRGASFADIDNDGDLDLCLTGDVEDLTRLWRNDTVTNNHWVTLTLAGTHSNRSAIGARVEVTTDIRTTAKEVSGGAGRGSQNSLPVEFGLGQATAIEQIVIRWPSGIVQTLDDVAMDQFLTVIETKATLIAATSLLSHGAGPGLALGIDLLAGNGIEPRLGGPQTFEFQFSENLDPDTVEPGNVQIECAVQVPPAVLQASLTQSDVIEVQLADALADADCCTISFNGLLDDFGGIVSDELIVRPLEGDVDLSGGVTGGDALLVKPHFGEIAGDDLAGPQFDYNRSGAVTGGDSLQIKTRFGHLAPDCL